MVNEDGVWGMRGKIRVYDVWMNVCFGMIIQEKINLKSLRRNAVKNKFPNNKRLSLLAYINGLHFLHHESLEKKENRLFSVILEKLNVL